MPKTTLIRDTISLQEANAVRNMVGNNTMRQQSGDVVVISDTSKNLIHASPEDLALLSAKSLDGTETAISRRAKNLQKFYFLVDKFIRELRLNSRLREDLRKTILDLAKDPEFSFTIKLVDHRSPLKLILELSSEDPKIYKNKKYIPLYLDRWTKADLEQAIKKEEAKYQESNSIGQRRYIHDSYAYDRFGVTAANSPAYLTAVTEFTKDLLSIAKSKGTDLRAPIIGGKEENIFDFTDNVDVTDWLSDNGALDADLEEHINFEKFISRLSSYENNEFANFQNLINGDFKLDSETLDELKAFFILSMKEYNESEQDPDFDPVSRVLGSSQFLPEDFLISLMEIAKDSGYQFDNSIEDEEGATWNILDVLLCPALETTDPSIIHLKLFKYLLNQGVDPFHSNDLELDMRACPRMTIEDLTRIQELSSRIEINTNADGTLRTANIPDEFETCYRRLNLSYSPFSMVLLRLKNYSKDYDFMSENWDAIQKREFPEYFNKLKELVKMFSEFK